MRNDGDSGRGRLVTPWVLGVCGLTCWAFLGWAAFRKWKGQGIGKKQFLTYFVLPVLTSIVWAAAYPIWWEQAHSLPPHASHKH